MEEVVKITYPDGTSVVKEVVALIKIWRSVRRHPKSMLRPVKAEFTTKREITPEDAKALFWMFHPTKTDYDNALFLNGEVIPHKAARE